MWHVTLSLVTEKYGTVFNKYNFLKNVKVRLGAVCHWLGGVGFVIVRHRNVRYGLVGNI